MVHDTSYDNRDGWIEAIGLPHILRTLWMALMPTKIGLALVAILMTFMWGGLLDMIWPVGKGIPADAITRYIDKCEGVKPDQAEPAPEPESDHGIFYVWREHERQCLLGLFGSSLPGASVAAETPVLGSYVARHSKTGPLRNIADMIYGLWWMFTQHFFYFAVFGAGLLGIWSYFGGAICRIASVEFARGEKLTRRQALAFVSERYVGGFLAAPCVPIVFILAGMLLLMAIGFFLRIPFVGDLLVAPLFGVAVLIGLGVTTLILLLFTSGHLYWPAVAAEGQDSFDACTQSVGLLVKPWKAILYGVLMTVYAAICWVFVNLFTFAVLKITRMVVGYGASWFGWWPRPDADNIPVSKIDLLWPQGDDPNTLYTIPSGETLAGLDYVSAVMIGIWVALAIALMWAFLASFYYSGATVVYFLLRRDADGSPLERVYIEGFGEEDPFGLPEPIGESAAKPATDVAAGQSLPDKKMQPPESEASDNTGTDG